MPRMTKRMRQKMENVLRVADGRVKNYVEAVRLMLQTSSHVILFGWDGRVWKTVYIAHRCVEELGVKIVFYKYNEKKDGLNNSVKIMLKKPDE